MGAGVLPEQVSGPLIVLSATIGSTSPVAEPASTTGPETVESTTAALPDVPVMLTGPRTVLWYKCTALAPLADTGPEMVESRASSDAPERTTTGPFTVAPSRHVLPSTTRGPLWTPVTVVVQVRTSWSKRARATAKLGAQVISGWCCGLNSASWTSPAAAISASVRCSLGSSRNTSKPRAISLP